jgi:hypothetical protein
MPYARIRIENLGPIRSGEFELRPLTIFIGPNNSGKTYAATAAYALVNALRFERRYRTHRIDDILFGRPPFGQVLSHSADNGTPLSDEIRNQVHARLEVIRQRAESNLHVGFLDAFATDNLAGLGTAPHSDQNLRVSLMDHVTGQPVIGVRANPIAGEPFIVLDVNALVKLKARDSTEGGPRAAYDGFPDDEIANELWGDLLSDLGLPLGDGLYLPSGRLGIIQGWTVLASSAIGSLRQRASRVRDELPPLPGVFADYLQRLVWLGTWDRPRSDYPEHFKAAAGLLESQVLEGQIVRERTALSVMRLRYRSGDLDLPLDRASSMVGDLASLAIAMKEQLAQGDLLVIDEPEAHLHPENERLVAQVLARLARAKVRVLVPTHSSTIIHQITNLVRSGLLPDETRHQLGFQSEDRLTPEQVGVYKFKRTHDGVLIEEVRYDPEFGFPEEGFYEVAEEISRETYQIESSLSARAG